MATEPVYIRKRPGATLLSLDGGGIKGISSLMILQEIMNRIRDKEGRDLGRERLPWEYFDLIGGTSTGGLAALMLCRLKMPTSAVIKEYKTLSSTVFAPTIGGIEIHRYPFGYSFGNFWLWAKRVLIGSAFSASRLVTAIDTVTGAVPGQAPLKGATKLRDLSFEGARPQQTGRMLMCATVAAKGETVLFRSYRLPADSLPQSETAKDVDHDNLTITQACRATSAAPTYLPAMEIPSKSGGSIKFWDGGLLNNSPIDQVWDARYDLPSARDPTATSDSKEYIEPVISCVVSIGTGYFPPPLKDSADRLPSVLRKTIGFATNTQAKHWDFMGNNIRRNKRLPKEEETKYFRYNAKASKDINLDDYKQMKVLEADTENYLEGFKKNIHADGIKMSADELEMHIEKCAEELAKTEPK